MSNSPAAFFKNLLKQFPFVMPKMVYSCKDWIDQQKTKKGNYQTAREDWYKLIEKSEYHHHPAPNSDEAVNKAAFDNNRSYKTNDAYLFNLKSAFLYRHKGIILSNYNDCFQEFSHHFNIQPLKKFLLKHPFYTFSKSYTLVQEAAAVLVSPESPNYYHWLFDVLPRIKLYGDVFNQVDYFYVSSAVPQKFLDVLPAFGVTKEKVKLLTDTEKLKFNNLFVGSLPGSEGRSPRWAVEFIREKLLISQTESPAGKKLYFKRGDAVDRKILNEDAIISLLIAEGFDIIEPDTLSITEQAALVNTAEIIISAHGAALSNLVFAQSGKCSVIELFSPDYFRTDCYYPLAGLLNLNYWYITGTKPKNAAWGDIIIAEEILTKTLASLYLD